MAIEMTATEPIALISRNRGEFVGRRGHPRRPSVIPNIGVLMPAALQQSAMRMG